MTPASTTPGPVSRRVLAVLAALALAGTLPSCDDSGAAGTADVAPAPADVSSAPAGAGPMLTVDRPGHDFGSISDVQPRTATFTITNTGSERLVIKEIKRGCGCTSVSLPKYDFLPGESASMQVVFDPKRKVGRQEKVVTLVSNTEPNGVTTLDIMATVEPMLRFIPDFIRFGTLTLGQEHRSTVRMYYNDPELEIRRVSTTHTDVTAEVVSAGEPDTSGQSMATIEVRVGSDAPWGVLFAARLVVDVYGRPDPDSDPIEHRHEVFITGTLFGELIAAPQIVNLGPLQPGQAFRSTIQLRRTPAAPFSIEGVLITDTTMPGMGADVRPIGPNVYEFTLHGTVPQTFRGGITGWLQIQTDVPGEETLRLRFSGIVR